MNDGSFCIFFYGDILGYRELLRHKSVAYIETALRESLSDVQRIVNLRQNDVDRRNASLAVQPEEIAKFFRWSGEGRFSYYFAFDTLLAFLRDLSRDGLEMRLPDFLLFCSSIYVAMLTRHNICLRGVIGLTKDYVIDRELVVFKEIDAAFDLEKSQNWSGVILNVGDEFLEYCGAISAASEDEFIFYPVPTKRGTREYPMLNPLNKYTVSFMREHSFSFSSAIARLEQESLQPDAQPDVKEKLRNTVTFLLDCKKRYRTSIEREQIFRDENGGFEEVP